MTLESLAKALDAETRHPQYQVSGVQDLEHAGPTDLSFALGPQYLAAVTASQAGALLVPLDFPLLERPTLRCRQPLAAMVRVIELLRPPYRPSAGIHPTASIDPSAEIGPQASIGAYVVIGAGCRLGARAVLHPHVVLYPDVIAGDDLLAHAHAVIREGTLLGHGVILQPGAILGGDGYGFTPHAGRHLKIPQVGRVVLGNQVEVQANSCVDRASLSETSIGDGTKIDNLVHIAHNSRLGQNILLCAQVGLAGSTRIEDNCTLAGQVGVAGHCTIGAGAIITAQSGAHGDLAGGAMYSGSPAFEHRLWLQAMALLPRLPALYRDWRKRKAEAAN
jgi:UDP-3-O-[3-hydroxymyristoyl] glucosamine N-acyltransferase